MKKFRQSLKTDLLVDLSLMTLCVLLLSEAVMILMLRVSVPEQIAEQVAPVMTAIRGMSPEQVKTPSRSLEVTRLNTWPTKGEADAAEGEIYVNTGDWLGVFRIVESAEMFARGPNGEIYSYRWVMKPIQDMLDSFKFRVFFVTLFIEFVLVILAYFFLFRRNVLIPIQRLHGIAREYQDENWAARFESERDDELAQIGRALSQMAQKIQEKERKLVLTIESLKEANEELELRQNEQLQIEKLASIGRLAAGVAHEVGNPLGAISGYVDILKRALQKMSAQKEDIELCDHIETETNRISKIIRALLQQARPTAERIKVVSLKPVLVRCVNLAQIPSAIDVSYEFQDESAQVLAEEDQLVQVFLNLLVNARQAIEARKNRQEPGRLKIRCIDRRLPLYRTSSDGSDYDTSVVRALKPESYWVVSLDDNGVGISEEDQKKLFEPFFSTKAPGKGTGLGLYVTKSIVESFRGAIVVRSAVGYGASFSVFLPKAKTQQTSIL